MQWDKAKLIQNRREQSDEPIEILDKNLYNLGNRLQAVLDCINERKQSNSPLRSQETEIAFDNQNDIQQIFPSLSECTNNKEISSILGQQNKSPKFQSLLKETPSKPTISNKKQIIVERIDSETDDSADESIDDIFDNKNPPQYQDLGNRVVLAESSNHKGTPLHYKYTKEEKDMIHTLTSNKTHYEPIGDNEPEPLQTYEDYMLWSKYENWGLEETPIDKKYIDDFVNDLDNMIEKEFFSKYSNKQIDNKLIKLFDINNKYICDRCYNSFDTRENLDEHQNNNHVLNSILETASTSYRLEKIMEEALNKKPIEPSRFTCFYANINGLNAKYEYLNKVILAFKRNIDIIILVESKIDNSKLAPFLTGYTYYKCDAESIVITDNKVEKKKKGQTCSAGLVIYIRILKKDNGNIY
jgi:hypothetical protein